MRYLCCMEKAIKRVDVLTAMETEKTFTIQFYKANGELVTLPRALSCGLRMNMKTLRKRGVQPTDASGNAIGHVYPVCIDNIRMFNNRQITI